MSASLDSTSTEDNVPVLKPKDLSLVPSPLFLRTPTKFSFVQTMKYLEYYYREQFKKNISYT